MGRYTLTLSLVVLIAVPAFAETDFGAELKIQQQALVTRDGDLLEQTIGDGAAFTTGSVRLTAQSSGQSWSSDLHYFLEGSYSSDFTGFASLTAPILNSNALDLQSEIGRGRYGSLNHRLDRASITHSTPRTVVRLGRQALTWGRGQVFQPLDLFNPFSPDAQDRSYKPGADMIYGQYLFDNGADIQAIVVPRRSANGDLNADASSAAIKALWPKGNVEVEAVAASDYGDAVFAFGSAGPLGDALWKFDVVSTHPENGGAVISAVASLHKSWSWRGRSISAYAEYYRNGFGVTDRRPVDELPGELTERIARGQIFATGRDYLNVGGTINWTPLLQITPVAAMNLNDRSVLALVTAQYNLSNKANVILSAQLPLGSRGSEYGGRRMSASADEFERTPYSFHVRFERYF